MSKCFYALALLAASLLMGAAPAMEVRFAGDQLILTGLVDGNEAKQVSAALDAAPAIRTVVLRNSGGGDSLAGYQIGELFRARGVATAVSGYCWSACSRMFLGGRTRRLTDDYPAGFTEVGFHGHYDAEGRLTREFVDGMGLVGWTVRHSDGKADPALVERWTHIPYGHGMMHFFHPALAARRGAASFLCQGTERAPVFGCEPVARTALDLGVLTDAHLVSSNDQVELRATVPARIVPSGWAGVEEVGMVPLRSEAGLALYRLFLSIPHPRAFAVSPTREHWGFSGGTAAALSRALEACHRHSGRPCTLYAADDAVVWTPPGPGHDGR